MKESNVTVLIPMAGAGKRFSDVGYALPKPFIPVNGKPMVQSVVGNLNIDGNHIFIIQKNHSVGNNLQYFLNSVKPGCKIIEVDELTEGPACTALLAEEHISDSPLLIINCDQMIHDFSISTLMEFCDKNDADGILGAFISSSKKNSYMKLDPQGEVTEVKEKIVISNIATNGVHFWKSGKDFIYSAKEMIKNNERYNNEFYIAPTFNYLIKNGMKILPFFYNLHWPIGVPEDLKKYQELYGNSQN
jgi:dTDP-glucose pyrophosphorylase